MQRRGDSVEKDEQAFAASLGEKRQGEVSSLQKYVKHVQRKYV